MCRAAKFLAITLGLLATGFVLLVVGAVYSHLQEERSRHAFINGLLAKEQLLNLNDTFGSNEICIMPVGVMVLPSMKNRRPDYVATNPLFPDPDPDLYWSILVMHRAEKTYDWHPVHFGDVNLEGDQSYCSDKLVLDIRKVQERWLAAVKTF